MRQLPQALWSRPNLIRIFIVIALGTWLLATTIPSLTQIWEAPPGNGLSVDLNGLVTGVDKGSPAAAARIAPGDRVAVPLPRDLFHTPPGPMPVRIVHKGSMRLITVTTKPSPLSLPQKLRFIAKNLSYVIFLVVGSLLLLLRPSPMTWAFYLYCVLRRWGDLGFYWPGASNFFWFNLIALAVLGGATCVLVAIFALRFPSNRLSGWRRLLNRIAIVLLVAFPAAWLYLWIRVAVFGLPSQVVFDALIIATSIVYLGASAIFIVTFFRSHGEERKRHQWILIFPVVLIMRVVAINQSNGLILYALPLWFSDVLGLLGVCVPIVVAYAVIRHRVFDVQFVISRALAYGAITSIMVAAFSLVDWFLSKQFATTRLALTAEITVALALGFWLNSLHRGVNRFIDSAFFRQRHLAEQRLARAAQAVRRAESHEAVDRFLVFEPVQALDLTAAALFHRDEAHGCFVRETTVGWDGMDELDLASDDPLVLHVLAERTPVRLAEVSWPSGETSALLRATVLASPVYVREQLDAIVFYGAHCNGADLDPDEVRALVPLAESAGAAYEHIETRSLQAQLSLLMHQRKPRERKSTVVRTKRNLRGRDAR
jgi:hypothetical protein